MKALKLCSLAAALAVYVPLASAQATRTWVSGVGDDVNPCSRTAPCKTYAGAISKTAPGGEISALDPGGFGGLTITKAITINGDGDLASVLVSGSPGITVSAGPSDTIILRSISINGTGGSGTYGVRFLSGAALIIENSTIYGFSQNSIDIALNSSGDIALKNVSIIGGANGIHVASTSGRVATTLNHVSIHGATNGIDSAYGFVTINESDITHNSGIGILAEVGEVNVENSVVSSNGTGVQVSTGATLRLANNAFYDNLLGFTCGASSTFASAGNNRKGGNTGGVGTTCTPNATVSEQ